jgi:type III pantothenate kinase
MYGIILTLDLGNSSCKVRSWRIAGSAPPECIDRVELDGDPERGGRMAKLLARWLRVRERPIAAVFSSVCGTDLEERIREVVEPLTGRVFLAPAPGVRNHCRHPETTGSDRLYAARGAAESVGRSVIVVDAGTALTVDALRIEEGEEPLFLGGAIAPGPWLLAGALESGAARLPYVEPRPGACALGRETTEAILGGVVVGFRGAARALVEEVAREADFPDAPVVISGGARPFLLEPRPFLARKLVEVSGLVHLGLVHAALASMGDS